MIVVVSNRAVNEGRTDHTLFGEQYHPDGDEVIRLAVAEKNQSGWKLELEVEDANADPRRDILPSERLFLKIRKLTRAGEVSPNWVLYVHGHNTTIKTSLERSHMIGEKYGVNVLLFSWPSNPGPNLTILKPIEYKRAAVNARRSSPALDRLLEKLRHYLGKYVSENCDFSISFMSYSQGNYLFENYVRGPIFDQGETDIFDNIVLCQADVDADGHHGWVPNLPHGNNIFVTINKPDSVLRLSRKYHRKLRLGQTTRFANAEGVTYVDFTGGKGVNSTHRMFDEGEHGNEAISDFFRVALNGGDIEEAEGLARDPRSGIYRLT